MRTLLAALMVVTTFASVVLLISHYFPEGAGWAGVCVAITSLYASVFAVWAFLGKESGKAGQASELGEAQRHILRDNLLYFAVAMTLLTFVLALIIHDDEKGIVRNLRNDWFVVFGSACLVLGYSTKAFWAFRRNWRLWVVIAVLFVLFTAGVMPILSQMEKVPLVLMTALANIEGLIALVALDWVFRPQARRRGALAR